MTTLNPNASQSPDNVNARRDIKIEFPCRECPVISFTFIRVIKGFIQGVQGRHQGSAQKKQIAHQGYQSLRYNARGRCDIETRLVNGEDVVTILVGDKDTLRNQGKSSR